MRPAWLYSEDFVSGRCLDHRRGGIGQRLIGTSLLSKGCEMNGQLASATGVEPCWLSSISADFRRAVQRLMFSSITMLIGVPHVSIT